MLVSTIPSASADCCTSPMLTVVPWPLSGVSAGSKPLLISYCTLPGPERGCAGLWQVLQCPNRTQCTLAGDSVRSCWPLADEYPAQGHQSAAPTAAMSYRGLHSSRSPSWQCWPHWLSCTVGSQPLPQPRRRMFFALHWLNARTANSFTLRSTLSCWSSLSSWLVELLHPRTPPEGSAAPERSARSRVTREECPARVPGRSGAADSVRRFAFVMAAARLDCASAFTTSGCCPDMMMPAFKLVAVSLEGSPCLCVSPQAWASGAITRSLSSNR